MRPYLTKIWFGNRYAYFETKRKYRLRSIKLGRFCGVVSYRRSLERPSESP